MTCQDTGRFSRIHAALAATVVLVSGLFATGCEELTSRRQIQEANKRYAEGKYREAAALYEDALSRTPDLPIGHHNAGLAYYKLFQPGDESKENRQIAEKSAGHFVKYLEAEPGDTKVISLLSTIWLDSGQYDKALAYWTDVLAKDPNSRDVIEKLANINRQAGDYEKAREWHMKRVELESEPGGKVKAFLDIATMQWSRLQKPELVDAERLAVCDIGIAALQKAEVLDPKHDLVQSLMGSLYQHRSLAHGAHWAKGVEAASQKFHQARFTEIKKSQKAEAPAGQPGQPGAAGQPGGTAESAPPAQPAAPGSSSPPAQK